MPATLDDRPADAGRATRHDDDHGRNPIEGSDMQQKPTVIDLNINNAEHVVIRVNGMTYARVLLDHWEGRDELMRKVELAEKVTATIPPLFELKEQISGYQEVRRLLAEGPSAKRLAVLRGVIDGLDNRDPEHDVARMFGDVGPEDPAYEYDRGWRYGMGITRYALAVVKRYKDYQEAIDERPPIITTPKEIEDAALALVARHKLRADVALVHEERCGKAAAHLDAMVREIDETNPDLAKRLQGVRGYLAGSPGHEVIPDAGSSHENKD